MTLAELVREIPRWAEVRALGLVPAAAERAAAQEVLRVVQWLYVHGLPEAYRTGATSLLAWGDAGGGRQKLSVLLLHRGEPLAEALERDHPAAAHRPLHPLEVAEAKGRRLTKRERAELACVEALARTAAHGPGVAWEFTVDEDGGRDGERDDG